MRIIISPAKKMNADTDTLPYRDLPALLAKTEQILERLRIMNEEELRKLWKCNDQIAALNVQRLAGMDLRRNLTPAIIAYEGIQYQYMAPDVFTAGEYGYVQAHLRILSGFYGVLRPLDGVTPYRLEMQAKLRMGEAKDLYAFWGDDLARSVLDGTDCVINLASKEYSICISKHLPEDKRMITCVFGDEKDGKIIEKGTMCKMARGEMVRFMAANQIERPQDIRAFEGLNYRYDAKRSDEQTYVFVRRKSEIQPEFE
ncbi:MAG: peroxide stress protein YaaA [Clostridia bacterium]|nr:peroxide stress protein YaaA [Clostridia bacterium]